MKKTNFTQLKALQLCAPRCHYNDRANLLKGLTGTRPIWLVPTDFFYRICFITMFPRICSTARCHYNDLAYGCEGRLKSNAGSESCQIAPGQVSVSISPKLNFL